jgi:hypothetical protein
VQQKYCCYDNQSGKSSWRHTATDLEISVELQSSRKPRHEELDIPHSSTTPETTKKYQRRQSNFVQKPFLAVCLYQESGYTLHEKTENLV